MTNKELIDKLFKFIDNFKDDNFKDDSNSIVYHGVEYTKGEFKSFERVIKKCKSVYGKNEKSSLQYNQKNRELYNARANYYYYKNKKHKTDKDFQMLEKASKTIARIKNEREIAKKEAFLEERRELQRKHGVLIKREEDAEKEYQLSKFIEEMKRIGEFKDGKENN